MSADPRRLEGNGAGLVREIALAERVKQGLGRLYRLGALPHVGEFATAAGAEEREAVFVRGDEDDLEIELRVPRLPGASVDLESAALDPLCQIIEGVSHFVYLAARVERRRATTQLELELQAEVDKYVVLAHSLPSYTTRASARLRERLFHGVTFCHGPATVEGERYRVANDAAHRFAERLERTYADERYDPGDPGDRNAFGAGGRLVAMRRELLAFFEMGQEEKLRASRP
ncbi:MAG: hypothetical protein IPF92_27210 [Myxococcales bacterium]|nr:hypothetical protein [Myxococcales bacterium]MBL0194059.1 hypothetical protein [Myxococcales bacterium]HQY65008.1 hypothetical protein [Polyangiaceae bacterium]